MFCTRDTELAQTSHLRPGSSPHQAGNGLKYLSQTPQGGTHLEGELLEADGEAGGGLISGTGLGDDGELGSRAVGVAGSNFDAGDVGSIKVKRGWVDGGGGGSVATARGSEALPGGELGAPSESRSGGHGFGGGRRQLAFARLRQRGLG